MQRARRFFPTQLIRLCLGLSLALSSGSLSWGDSNSMRFRLTFEPATLDWSLGDVAIPVVQNTMRGLYRVDEHGKVVPDLVRSARAKGRVWTLEIRRGLKWSDSKPLTARDFVDAWKRLKDPSSGSTYGYLLDEIQSVRAPTKSSLKIELKNPVSYLPAILTHWVTYPIRKDLIEKWKDYGQNPAHMAFLGAYRIASWERSVKMTLLPNPKSEIHPKIQKVEAWVVMDDATALNLYETHRLDLMTDPGLTARQKHRSETVSVASPISYFIGIGKAHPLTRTREGILALSAALNREEIPLALGSPHEPTLEFVPPILQAAPPKSSGTPFELKGDPAQAKVFLEKAGFPPPAKVPPIQLRFFEKPSIRQLAEWIQNQWEKNLGIQVTLDSREPKTYWVDLAKNPAAFFLNSKGASFPDAQAFFELLLSKNEQNLGRWSDSDFDRWVTQASIAGQPQRTELYSKASQRLIWEKPGLIPLYFRNTDFLIQPRLKGVLINPLTSVDFSREAHFE